MAKTQFLYEHFLILCFPDFRVRILLIQFLRFFWNSYLNLGIQVGTRGLNLGIQVGTRGLNLGIQVGTRGLNLGIQVGTRGLNLGIQVGTRGLRELKKGN